MKTQNLSEKIKNIASEMASITEFAVGSITKSYNFYKTKDGTRKKSKPHYKFQSVGPRGKRKYKHIPSAMLSRIQKLINNGKRYKKLQAQYEELITEESLNPSVKKNTKYNCHDQNL